MVIYTLILIEPNLNTLIVSLVTSTTVDDTFDKQKIENDSNFQILSNQVASELTALLQNNGELNEVYNLYLNPNATTQ